MGLDISLYESRNVFAHKYDKSKVDAINFDTEKIKPITLSPLTNSWGGIYSPWESTSSIQYPDHLCNRRYLRSSYNEAGYDRKADYYRTYDLYTIFDPLLINEGDSFDGGIMDCSKERLEQCLELAKENRDMWYSLDDKQFGLLEIESYSNNNVNPPLYRYKDEIIEEFTEKYKDMIDDKDHFIHVIGETHENQVVYFENPIEVYGIVQNILPWKNANKEYWGRTNLVIKIDIQWYKEMSDIIIEFIEEALSMQDPEISFWG